MAGKSEELTLTGEERPKGFDLFKFHKKVNKEGDTDLVARCGTCGHEILVINEGHNTISAFPEMDLHEIKHLLQAIAYRGEH